MPVQRYGYNEVATLKEKIDDQASRISSLEDMVDSYIGELNTTLLKAQAVEEKLDNLKAQIDELENLTMDDEKIEYIEELIEKLKLALNQFEKFKAEVVNETL